jgi:hypothetical protein
MYKVKSNESRLKNPDIKKLAIKGVKNAREKKYRIS